LPDWAVLALNPVGADRVRPMTGVVISEQGLVIVPMDFAAPGDQIIVLDGGTDIIANGRAATIKQRIPEAGLTVLSAPALKRQPARLSATLSDGDPVRLAAFPPAEQIAQGAAPVSEQTPLSIAPVNAPDGGQTLAITIVKPLPNVTGPLIDRCGNLAGFSSADGVQSMDTTKAPSYLWKDDLVRALRRLPLELPQLPCPENSVMPAEEVSMPPKTAAEVQPQADMAAPAEESSQPAGVDGAAPQTPSGNASSPMMQAWLGSLAAVVLALLAWLFIRKRSASASRGGPPDRPTSADDETGAGESPASRPDISREQTDCVVEISGRLPDGAPFIGACDVNGAAIDVIVGRGRAGITIDSEGVHREHVRLSGSKDTLTISDLGSPRGTWINRVPCMKGEIMFIGAEDTIFLGDVSFQIRVTQKQDRNGGSGGD